VQPGAEFLGDTKPCVDFYENAKIIQSSQQPYKAPASFINRMNLKNPNP